MPKRSTDFQRLVAIVSRHKSVGATVTESRFLLDKDGGKHEIDVVVEDKVGGTPVTISIECIEQGRPADDGWVNRMKGKHDRLPTDILVLYSRSGFTRGAVAAAKEFRKRLVTWESLSDGSVEALLNGIGTMFAKMLAQTVTKTTVVLRGETPAEEVELSQTSPIFRESGDVITTAAIMVDTFLRLPHVLSGILRQCEEHYKKFEVRISNPTEGTGNQIYCRRDEFSPLRMIEILKISGLVEMKTSPVPLTHGKLEDTVVAFGKTQHEGKQAIFVASKDEAGETKATLDIEGTSFPLHQPPKPS
jgi:hypothetical protein